MHRADLTETDSWLGTGIDPSCSPTFTASVNKQIDDVYKSVERAYRATCVNAEGHGGSVIAAGYPRIFPTTVQGQTCSALSPFLTVDDQSFLNTAVSPSSTDVSKEGGCRTLSNRSPGATPRE